MNTTQYTGIDEYLFQKRTQQELSQESLALQLQDFSPLFSELDSLTISRWERGRVSPNIRRQVALMEFFGDEPHLLLADPNFELKQLPSMSAFLQMLAQQTNYNHVMGAHPYIPQDEPNFEKLNKHSDNLLQKLRWVSNSHNNLTRQRESWDTEFLAQLVLFSSTEAIFYQIDDILMGHSIYIRIDEDTLSALLSGKMQETQLTTDDLIEKDQPACLYMLSAYIGGRHVAEDSLLHMLFTLVENPLNLSLGYKARSDIGIKLMDFLSGKRLGQGERLKDRLDGAKYLGKRYSYISFNLQRAELLATPLMLNVMRKQAST
ncbi:helix-turn-helix transcriptional regulator [Shewanella eurypsychrophilus]|uniref:Helix-turn-helix transcriptional regulator n=1 Tax=Shewanella eurypsychrophilus TaxID=2593656 RepID=A0ABX6VDS1_9GAMM|nr:MULTISPECIES: helix-turn-helix transcriptional regulator [Shewanella]QFU24513.1 hypothetical protein FS418_23455 [Shewanella sp. YLB-09]QPG59711.1 helix-turn-helix transcriptional regulator [Shewanella eurypsychrophilus]